MPKHLSPRGGFNHSHRHATITSSAVCSHWGQTMEFLSRRCVFFYPELIKLAEPHTKEFLVPFLRCRCGHSRAERRHLGPRVETKGQTVGGGATRGSSEPWTRLLPSKLFYFERTRQRGGSGEDGMKETEDEIMRLVFVFFFRLRQMNI